MPVGLSRELKTCVSNVESIAGNEEHFDNLSEVENQKVSFGNHTLEVTYFDRRKPESMLQHVKF